MMDFAYEQFFQRLLNCHELTSNVSEALRISSGGLRPANGRERVIISKPVTPSENTSLAGVYLPEEEKGNEQPQQ